MSGLTIHHLQRSSTIMHVIDKAEWPSEIHQYTTVIRMNDNVLHHIYSQHDTVSKQHTNTFKILAYSTVLLIITIDIINNLLGLTSLPEQVLFGLKFPKELLNLGYFRLGEQMALALRNCMARYILLLYHPTSEAVFGHNVKACVF